MIWRKVNDHLITSAGWSICKLYVGDKTRYTLWHGKDLIDCCDTAEELKQMAEKGI